MRCFTSNSKQPQLADSFTHQLGRYVPAKAWESVSSGDDRNLKEEVEIAERLKQLPKLLASLESFSEK